MTHCNRHALTWLACATCIACSGNRDGSDRSSVGAAAPSSPVAVVDDAFRTDLFAARDRVWRAWFENDTTVLHTMLPAEFVGIGFGGGPFDTRETALKSSADFAKAGGKFVSLTFSDDRIQRFGAVTTVFSNYALVFVMGSDTTRQSGRATEVFEQRNGQWLNPAWHVDSGK